MIYHHTESMFISSELTCAAYQVVHMAVFEMVTCQDKNEMYKKKMQSALLNFDKLEEYDNYPSVMVYLIYHV